MKHVLICIALIFSFSILKTNAQKFGGGFVAGFVTSQVEGDTYGGFHKAGLLGGMWINYDFAQKSALQMELTYIQKGSRKSANPDQGDYDTYLLRLGYVELGLIYQYTFAKKFFIEAGPSFSVLLHSYEEDVTGMQKESDNFKVGTFNVCIGAGYNISEKWNVHLRTENSITSIRNDVQTGYVARFGKYGQYIDCLTLSLYYKLR